jgi:hypothetical protein
MRRTILPVFFSAACAAACSDGGGGTGGGGDTTSSSSSASSTSSASSSGIVLPTPDGAFVLSMTQDDPTSCSIASHTAAVGEVDASKRTSVITDGMSGTTVACTVAGTSSFQVHGQIEDPANSGNLLQIAIPSIAPGASEGAPAAGTVAASGSWTAGAVYSGACSFYFTPGTPETVGTGKVWVTFACPGVTAGTSTCPIKIGYAIFENCLTQ